MQQRRSYGSQASPIHALVDSSSATLSQISADNMLVARTGFIKGSLDAAMVLVTSVLRQVARSLYARSTRICSKFRIARYRSMGDTQRLALQAFR
jgi:hypothetical protein